MQHGARVRHATREPPRTQPHPSRAGRWSPSAPRRCARVSWPHSTRPRRRCQRGCSTSSSSTSWASSSTSRSGPARKRQRVSGAAPASGADQPCARLPGWFSASPKRSTPPPDLRRPSARRRCARAPTAAPTPSWSRRNRPSTATGSASRWTATGARRGGSRECSICQLLDRVSGMCLGGWRPLFELPCPPPQHQYFEMRYVMIREAGKRAKYTFNVAGV